jgi:di/tricarboxylate transporter
MFGIAHEMFKILGFKKGDRWPRYVMIMITFSAVIGFCMTPICHTLPILWMSIYSAIVGQPASIASYCAAGIPVGLVIWIIMMVWMNKVIKVHKNVPQLDNIDWTEIERMKPGKIEAREKYVIVVCILLLISWILPSVISLFDPTNPIYLFCARLSDSSFLFIAVVLLAVVRIDGKPVLNLMEAFREMNWIPVVLLAGIMMVATAMGEEPTGIPAAISMYIVPLAKGMSPWAMVALVSALSVFLTNIANNVPVGIIFISAGVPMCLELGINPFPLALGVCVGANLAYTIPPAYVPIGTCYADPWCEGKTVFKNGVFMAIASMVVCAVLIYPIANLVS